MKFEERKQLNLWPFKLIQQGNVVETTPTEEKISSEFKKGKSYDNFKFFIFQYDLNSVCSFDNENM